MGRRLTQMTQIENDLKAICPDIRRVSPLDREASAQMEQPVTPAFPLFQFDWRGDADRREAGVRPFRASPHFSVVILVNCPYFTLFCCL